ncbi:MAG: homoserine dehydrogenase [Candidatus Woesearchaeota archaeon]
MKKVNIGMFGCGNIGQGVVKILERNSDSIAKKTDIEINLKNIVVRDPKKERDINTSGYFFSNDPSQILDNDDIDIVIELVGGVKDAKDLVFNAIRKKKHVVTANKALMAEFGDEIFRLAKENNVKINYEASVGGCIPIIKALNVSLVSDRINSIFGILNGTTNYILSKMANEKMDFDKALKKAQDLGFAESDPSFDLSGKDAAQKLVVAARLAFNTEVSIDDIYVEGIEGIKLVDIKAADDMGFAIKLLAIAKREKDMIEMRVHPALIRKDHLLAKVNDEINAIVVHGDNIKEQMYYGRGAGQLPTASAVVSDVIDILRREEMEFNYESFKIRKMDDLELKYYMRFMVEDKPGALAAITKILADYGISIFSIHQKEGKKENVPVVLMTHKAKESMIKKAVSEIDRLDIIREKTLLLREESLD